MTMNSIELQERNKQIALMLGWKYYEPKVDIDTSLIGRIYERCEVWAKIPIELNRYEQYDQYYFTRGWYEKAIKESGCGYLTSLKYHSDWNWLIEAIRFIQKKSFDITIDFFSSTGILKTDAFVSKNSDIIVESLGKEDIEAMFEIVSDFAKLYNEKKL